MNRLQTLTPTLPILALAASFCARHPSESARTRAIDTDAPHGRETVRYRAPDGLQEICVLPTHLPGFKYTKKDVERESALCALNFYKQENDSSSGNVVGLCPKVTSTNPAIDLLETDEANTKSLVEADQNCKGRKRTTKSFAKFKQAWGDALPTCTFSQAAHAYYPVSRALGGIANILPSVLRSMSLSEHDKIARRGLELASGTIRQSWKFVRDSNANPVAAAMKGRVYSTDLKQVTGVLFSNLRGAASFTALDDLDNSTGFKWLTDPEPLASALSRDFANAAPRIVLMRGIADMLLMDFLMSQADRFSGDNIKSVDYVYWFQNGKVEKEKASHVSEGKVEVPAGVPTVALKEVFIEDNDCAFAGNPVRQKGYLAAIRHMNHDTYARLRWFAKAFPSDPAIRSAFRSDLGWIDRDFPILEENLKAANEILTSNCRAGKLRLDLDLEDFMNEKPMPDDCDAVFAPDGDMGL